MNNLKNWIFLKHFKVNLKRNNTHIYLLLKTKKSSGSEEMIILEYIQLRNTFSWKQRTPWIRILISLTWDTLMFPLPDTRQVSVEFLSHHTVRLNRRTFTAFSIFNTITYLCKACQKYLSWMIPGTCRIWEYNRYSEQYRYWLCFYITQIPIDRLKIHLFFSCKFLQITLKGQCHENCFQNGTVSRELFSNWDCGVID